MKKNGNEKSRDTVPLREYLKYWNSALKYGLTYVLKHCSGEWLKHWSLL
jgi:hypothetical protein